MERQSAAVHLASCHELYSLDLATTRLWLAIDEYAAYESSSTVRNDLSQTARIKALCRDRDAPSCVLDRVRRQEGRDDEEFARRCDGEETQLMESEQRGHGGVVVIA